MPATMNHPFGPCPFGVARRIFRVKWTWVCVSSWNSLEEGCPLIACNWIQQSGKHLQAIQRADVIDWRNPLAWRGIIMCAAKQLHVPRSTLYAAFRKGTA